MISFSIVGLTRLMLCLMLIIAAGYLLGRISIKGISLETAGVFVAALLFGALFPAFLESQLSVGPEGARVSYLCQALDLVKNLGLILFVSAVGFIAGPKFFANFKRNFKSYVLLGAVIILAGGLTAVGCLYLGRLLEGGSADFDPDKLSAMIAGLLSGALTSTPAFSTALDTVRKVSPEFESVVSVGYAIAYLFGVIGVVLFVQLMPKISRADMAEERKKLAEISSSEGKKAPENPFLLDDFGIAPFALASAIGLLLGKIEFCGFFSLGSTGGCLLASLVMGHFGRIGKISLMPKNSTLKVFRELGLVLFLIGAGISGGMDFVEHFKLIYFVYGAIMTVVPLVLGYLFAKYVLKLPLLNKLGSITGGMTSTPALGTLIHVAGTEDVAAAYAATYPVALIAVVFVSQLLILCF